MEKSFQSLISAAKSILILLPKDPYFDQVAAGVSLYLALKDKKDVTVSCPSPMLVEFNKIVGVNKVTSEPGSKNLVIKIKNYSPDSLERVTYDVDTSGQVELLVIPKDNSKPPTKEQIDLSYAGVSADTIILIGGINESHFPILSSKNLLGAKIIHIGTKDFHGQGAEILSFAEGTSSVSEIVAKLLKEEGMEITQDLATNLLMGIHEGTKSFTRSEVTSETFKLASELMEKGGKNIPVAQPQPTSQHFSRPAFGINPLERPQGETTNPNPTPQSWTQPPKIFKGTSIS